jgi:uncharacterized Zn-finger protein
MLKLIVARIVVKIVTKRLYLQMCSSVDQKVDEDSKEIPDDLEVPTMLADPLLSTSSANDDMKPPDPWVRPPIGRITYMQDNSSSSTQERHSGQPQAMIIQPTGQPVENIANKDMLHTSSATMTPTTKIASFRPVDPTQSGRPCPFCQKLLTSPRGYKLHIDAHKGIFPHTCSYCARGFLSKTALEGHVVQHTNKKMYMCGICGKEFKYKHGLNYHHHVCPMRK